MHVTFQSLNGKCTKEQLRHVLQQSLPLADVSALGTLLRKCATAKALPEGRLVHFHIRNRRYDANTYLGNLLVQMYGKCGSLEEACKAFNTIREPNSYSYNNLISAYAHNGHLREAKGVFDSMPEQDFVTWTVMLVAYAHYGQVSDAKCMFDEMPQKDVVAWNTMIAAYAQNGHDSDAIQFFREMDLHGVQMDKITFLNLMHAFTRPELQAEAKLIHEDIIQSKFDKDVVLATAIVNMYGKSGCPENARRVFDKIADKNVVSWTAMVAAYAQNGCVEDAESIFKEMPHKNTVSWNAMLAAYAHNGYISNAGDIFEQIPIKDLASWNTMIATYAFYQNGNRALNLFKRMVVEGVQPDKITLVGILDACALIPNLAEGRLVHAAIVDTGYQLDVILRNSLIDMYGKCGSLKNAREVFDKTLEPTVVSWNAIMVAYSHNGQCDKALHLFDLMHLEGMHPDAITYLTVLFTCSHGGIYDPARDYFRFMSQDYAVQPVLDHYVCMIDLLGRAGQLSDAEDLVENMPFESDVTSWRALLSACKVQGDRNLGASISKHTLSMEPKRAASYVMLSNIYAIENKRKAV